MDARELRGFHPVLLPTPTTYQATYSLAGDLDEPLLSDITPPPLIISLAMPSEDQRSALLRASKPPSKELFSTLITANHILHNHSVVDAYGHISVRNPQNPQTFFLSRSLAPALVSRREDLEEYRVEDASPVNEGAAKGYAERFIHSETYKKYSGVNSVVHAHNESVLPFSITSVPLKPVFHMGGVMGEF